MDKAASLQEILTADPGNALARYGLAMEYAGRGETATALVEFTRLVGEHPDYTAGYQMAAQTLLRAGRAAEAKEWLVRGIACAGRTGNRHAQSEMEGMVEEQEADRG